jgi:hypothetical protein
MADCLAEYDKHPLDVLDIIPDYTGFLDGDVITASSWAGDGLTVASSSFTGATTRVRLSGGVSGREYEPANTFSTAGGITEVRRYRIYCHQCDAPDSTQVGWRGDAIT